MRFLVQWCGTGLDLAADYDSYELARIATALLELLKKLNAIHEEHGADLCRKGHKMVITCLEDKTKDFLYIKNSAKHVLRNKRAKLGCSVHFFNIKFLQS